MFDARCERVEAGEHVELGVDSASRTLLHPLTCTPNANHLANPLLRGSY
jgi:hypothetical protein